MKQYQTLSGTGSFSEAKDDVKWWIIVWGR
jgi:hypothetical protein